MSDTQQQTEAAATAIVQPGESVFVEPTQARLEKLEAQMLETRNVVTTVISDLHKIASAHNNLAKSAARDFNGMASNIEHLKTLLLIRK